MKKKHEKELLTLEVNLLNIYYDVIVCAGLRSVGFLFVSHKSFVQVIISIYVSP